FDALHVAVELARRIPLADVRLKDPALADQMQRATLSIVLNLAEGRGRAGRDRIRHWNYSLGSARELHAALLLGEAFQILDTNALTLPLELLDRLHAMLWKLTRR